MKKYIYCLIVAVAIALIVNISFADQLESSPQNDFVLRQVLSVYDQGANDKLPYAAKMFKEMHERKDIFIEARPMAPGVDGCTKKIGEKYYIIVNSDRVSREFLNSSKTFYDLIVIILLHEFQHVLDFDKSEVYIMAETMDRVVIPFLANNRYVPDGLKRIRELYRQCGDCATTEKWHNRVSEVYK